MNRFTIARAARFFALATIFAATGCDDGGGGAAADAPRVESPQALWAQVAEANCRQMFACCAEGETLFPDEQTCASALGGLLNTGNEIFDLGWAQFDGVQAGACAAEIDALFAAAECGAPATVPGEVAACARAIVGLQGEGEPCGKSEDGFAVAYGAACAAGLKCVRTADSEVPVCAVEIEDGGACTRDEARCSDASYCAGAPGEAGVCTALTPVGEACEADAECGEEGECSDGVCAPLGGSGSMCGF